MRLAASLGRTVAGWGEMLHHALPLLAAFRRATWRSLWVGEAVDRHQPAGDYW